MKAVIIHNRDGWGLDGVGESYRPEQWKKLVGTTPLNKEFKQSLMVQVVPEFDNKHDKNAIGLFVDGIHLGYLERDDAKRYRKQVEEIATSGAALLVTGNIWWVRRSDGLKANIRVNLPQKLIWDGSTEDFEPEVQVVRQRSPKREWWSAVALLLVLSTIPYAGPWLGLLAFATAGYLITSGRFRYGKNNLKKP